MRTRILYATNGGKPARDAGVLLRRLADPDLVHVTVDICDSVEFTFPEEPWKFGDEWRPRAQPREIADTETASFEAEGFEADYHLGSGVPGEQILELPRTGDYDITMLGAGRSSWLGNLLLGSTSTRVLHASPASVLIVHRFEDRRGDLEVLLATDGSPNAEHSLSTFINLAHPKKVAVTVVSVSDTLLRAASLYGGEVMPPIEALSYLEGEAKKSADRAEGLLTERGFSVNTETPSGEPVREILELAKHMDLVVLGSRGLGAVSRLVMGSVSEQVARLAPATLVCRQRRTPPK